MKIGIKVSSNDNNCTVEINGSLIPLLVVAILVGISVVVTLCFMKSMDFKYIVFAAIFMVTAVVVFLLAFEVSKPFVKMAFLKSIIKSGANDNELIKKYCDTLVEL